MARAAQRKGECATLHNLSIAEIKELISSATDMQSFESIERSLASDTRKGVQQALATARRRLEADAAEIARIDALYSFQEEIAQMHGGGCIVGLDEVGRGPLAGPLAVGAVVLPVNTRIAGLNDSKQVKPAARREIAEEIRCSARAYAVEFIEPDVIDACGMTACLITAFRRALAYIENAGILPDVVLLDGNPLHFDSREVNIVKGDAKCASIAAASILAKVERDALMEKYALDYPLYGFESNKGYASASHIEAIKQFGLSPIHRESFCTSFTQPTLF